MLKQLQIHRKILYDLLVHYLGPLSSGYGRLAYMAALRDPITGKYAQEKLAAVYGEERVSETLAKCHEEMFERVVELPLARQEEDLRNYVSSLPAGHEWNDAQCIDTTRTWVPAESPEPYTAFLLKYRRSVRTSAQ